MNQISLESRVDDIESRNTRVDANKRWETSWVRRISIAVLTYATIVAYHIAIGAKNPFVISIVPVIGFVLSTLSLSIIRRQCERKYS